MLPLLTLVACTTAPADPPVASPDSTPIAEAPPPPPPAPEPIPESGAFTRELAPGLSLAAHLPVDVEGEFNRVDPAEVGGTDARIYVLTIDPVHYELRYVSLLQEGQDQLRTASDWAEHVGAVAAWNPGMFEPDGKATGYTRSGDFTSQPKVRRNALYSGFFTVTEGRASVEHLTLPGGSGTYRPYTELAEADRETLEAAELVSQSLTVLRAGESVYPPRTRYWSELAYGVDDQGRVVVVFTRYPYEMREFAARVAALDIGVTDLIHGEGGPESTLAIRQGDTRWSRMGSFETGFADDNNQREWVLPAVIVAVPRGPTIGR